MITNQEFIKLKYCNKLLITTIIWSAVLYRTISTNNSTEMFNSKLDSIKNNTTKGNLTTDFWYNVKENKALKNQLYNGSSIFSDNNNTKTLKLKNLKQQRSFQYPSGFMLPENNNDYTKPNPITPKFMSSPMTSSPASSSDHMQHINYLRYGASDNTASDDQGYETYSSPDDYYHHSHHHHPIEYAHMPPPPPMMMPSKSSLFSTDTLKILLIALLKLLLIKLATIGFIKLIILFILKLPILFFGFLLKVLFFVKISNLFKILTIPIFLPLLLLILAPLLIPLLAPLLLLPLLLPLLLFLPIPVLTVTTTTTTTTTTAAPGKRRRRRYLDMNDINQPIDHKWTKSMGDLEFFRHLIESEMCFERIACKLAADKRAISFSSYISRMLDTLKYYLFNPRLDSYVTAYRMGASKGSTFATCVRYYPCTKFKT